MVQNHGPSSRGGLSRRVVLQAGLGGLSLGLPPATLAQARSPRILGLVVGINEYTGRYQRPRSAPADPPVLSPLLPLKGAVNDARAITAALSGLGADLVTLTDRGATRTAILDRLRAMIAKARPGDLLFFSVSAHGGQQPARLAGSTPTGLEETIILGGFDSVREPGERIFNDELGRIIRSAADTGARFLYIGDTCHAGGTVRRADARIPRLAGYRGGIRYDVEADLAAPAPPDAGKQVPAADIGHLLFLAGAQANELVPEVLIDGDFHGALSHAVALALRGGAFEEGRLTAGALSRFVLRVVRNTSDSSQHPQLIWPNPMAAGGLGIQPSEVLFARPAEMPAAPVAPPPLPKPTPPAETGLPVWIVDQTVDEARGMLAGIPGVSLAASEDRAILYYESTQRLVLDRAGRLLAERLPLARLSTLAERQVLIETLRAEATRSGLETRIEPGGQGRAGEAPVSGDDVHAQGQRLRVLIEGFAHSNLIVFNLAGDGTVQLLYPLARFGDSLTIAARHYELPVQVKAPFGSDHVVAIASERPLAALLARLVALDGKPEPARLLEVIRTEFASGRRQLGIQGIFTRG
jgi:hypothetical protein